MNKAPSLCYKRTCIHTQRKLVQECFQIMLSFARCSFISCVITHTSASQFGKDEEGKTQYTQRTSASFPPWKRLRMAENFPSAIINGFWHLTNKFPNLILHLFSFTYSYFFTHYTFCYFWCHNPPQNQKQNPSHFVSKDSHDGLQEKN